MDFKHKRLELHNNFPTKVTFKAEQQFQDLLNSNNTLPFITFNLDNNNDTNYQIYIGHFIDGLEALPYRPDYMFDHAFKIIDDAGRPLFKKKGIKGIVQGLPNKLLTKDRKQWEAIIDELGKAIPLMTCRFITKRLTEANSSTDQNSKYLTSRAKECFGQCFYDEFIEKFSGNTTLKKEQNKNLNNGASFIKLYLSGIKGTNHKYKKNNSPLNLTKEANLPSHKKRAEFLLSLLLYTTRNERAHGTVLSPFRTSKSSIDRYQSYYFSMLSAYIFAIGILQVRDFIKLTNYNLLECCRKNIALQTKFFS